MMEKEKPHIENMKCWCNAGELSVHLGSLIERLEKIERLEQLEDLEEEAKEVFERYGQVNDDEVLEEE